MMIIPIFPALTVACAIALATRAADLPPGAVSVEPLKYDVVGANYQWRTNNSFVGFNPTNTTPPFIQVFDQSFLDVIGSNATIRLVSSNPSLEFADGAPIYVPNLNVVFFSSNASSPPGGWNNNSVVSVLNMTEVTNAVAHATGDVNVQAQTFNLSNNSTVQMVAGGTGPYKGSLLCVTAGRALLPPSVVLINPNSSDNNTVLLDNFYGRQFNSLRDVKVLPGSDVVFFTDSFSGWQGGFRPEPMLPSQVYRFEPSTGQIRVVADQFVNPAGITFTPSGKTAFVTDTGAVGASSQVNQTYPATIYQFDVDPTTQTFSNRRVFAYSDSGVPNGIQLDTNGNVYSGCGDGTHVWNSNGTLIGKFFLNGTTPDMVFTNSGLLILNERKVYLADIQARGINLTIT